MYIPFYNKKNNANEFGIGFFKPKNTVTRKIQYLEKSGQLNLKK